MEQTAGRRAGRAIWSTIEVVLIVGMAIVLVLAATGHHYGRDTTTSRCSQDEAAAVNGLGLPGHHC